MTTIDPRNAPLEGAHLLAGHIVAQIRKDDGVAFHIYDDDINSFSDLHNFVDANEYLVEADAVFGWVPDLNDDEDVAVLNAATDIVSGWLAAALRAAESV